MMDWQRIVLIMGMCAVGVMLLIRWNEFQEQRQPVIETDTTTPAVTTPAAAPVGPSVPAEPVDPAQEIPAAVTPEAQQPASPAAPAGSQLITVKTDTLEVIIDTYGGDIVKVALPQYPVSLEQPNVPLVLLNRNDTATYIAQSGLIGNNATDKQSGERPVFTAASTRYSLAESQDTLNVDLTLQQGDVSITKRFVFHRGDNLVNVQYLIDNQSTEEWSAHLYAQIRRDDHEPSKTTPGLAMSSFLGVATTTDESNYDKFDFDDIADGDFPETRVNGGWLAFVQHYFISAWIPEADSTNTYNFFKLSNRDMYIFRVIGEATRVAPGQQATINADFYAGPKNLKRMAEISPHLELTIDYGPLFFICKPLFLFLNWLHSWLGNWGFAIILLTVAVKALFYPLSAKGYKSMARMRKFSPKLAELKERYGDNRQKFQEEMMKIYKKEGVNPLGGCLPMLVQIPVFIALYWVLMESVELRHAPFILWITDLSVKDPYFILPLLYGAIFFFQQKLQPAVGDPTQQKIMQMMPIMFTFLFLFFASGLVLYWVVNGALSMLQQYVITRRIEKAGA